MDKTFDYPYWFQGIVYIHVRGLYNSGEKPYIGTFPETSDPGSYPEIKDLSIFINGIEVTEAFSVQAIDEICDDIMIEMGELGYA